MFREEIIKERTGRQKQTIVNFNINVIIGYFFFSLFFLGINLLLNFLAGKNIIGKYKQLIEIGTYVFIFNFLGTIYFIFTNLVGIIESIEIMERKVKKNRWIIKELDDLNL